VLKDIVGATTVIENSLVAVIVPSVALIVNVVVVFEATTLKFPVIAPVELFKETLAGRDPVVTEYVSVPEVVVAVTADNE
tara:strand:- start:133 stop:372 length:240 start_codon:yes stop_codon:yes gene_type:complete